MIINDCIKCGKVVNKKVTYGILTTVFVSPYPDATVKNGGIKKNKPEYICQKCLDEIRY